MKMKKPNSIVDGPTIVREWNRWIESEQGRKMSSGITTGEYLRNRLRYAFKAGIHAAEIHLEKSGAAIVRKAKTERTV